MTVTVAPCPAHCPTCLARCYGAAGHTRMEMAGRQFATLHQCRSHAWGTISEMIESQRSSERETRREMIALISGSVSPLCLARIKRVLNVKTEERG